MSTKTQLRQGDRVLIVCAGNTCRSPMAQGILSRIVGSKAIVESAGLDAAQGLPATSDAISVMREIGIDLTEHRSRSIVGEALGDYDLIVSMTSSIGERLCEMGANPARLIHLDIPDPYGKGIQAYRVTRESLYTALKCLFEVV